MKLLGESGLIMCFQHPPRIRTGTWTERGWAVLGTGGKKARKSLPGLPLGEVEERSKKDEDGV